MTATSQPTGGPVELARELKRLRRYHSVPQRTVAEAVGVSVALVSAWESETNPAVPSDSRLRDLATFYASDRSWSGDRGRLLTDDDLGPAEREVRDEVLAELRSVAAIASQPAALPTVREAPSILRFTPGQDIRIVCGNLERPSHPYTDTNDLNYTDLLTFADIDALIELFGFLRKVNPDSDVRFIRADRLMAAGSPDDLASHLILLGGVGLNALTEQLLNGAAIPIRQKVHPTFADQGEVFEVTGGLQEREQFLPVVVDDQLIEDVGLLSRTPNPFHSQRTLTICNGVFARGVLGAVRALTDDKLRRQNERYIGRFADTDPFAILMRVPVLLGKAQTPDLQNARTRLYEWRGDAVPSEDSNGREMAG